MVETLYELTEITGTTKKEILQIIICTRTSLCLKPEQ